MKRIVVVILVLALMPVGWGLTLTPVIPDNVVVIGEDLTVSASATGYVAAKTRIYSAGMGERDYPMLLSADGTFTSVINLEGYTPGPYVLTVLRDVDGNWSTLTDIDTEEYAEIYVSTQEYIYTEGSDVDTQYFSVLASGEGAALQLDAGFLSLSLSPGPTDFLGNDGREYYAARLGRDEIAVFGNLDLEDANRWPYSIEAVQETTGGRSWKISNVRYPENQVIILWDEDWLSKLGIRAVDYYFVPHQPNTQTWWESPWIWGSSHAQMHYNMVKRTTWLNFITQEQDLGSGNTFQHRLQVRDAPDINMLTQWVGNRFSLGWDGIPKMGFALGTQTIHSDDRHTLKVQQRNQYGASAFRGGLDEDGVLYELIVGGGE